MASFTSCVHHLGLGLLPQQAPYGSRLVPREQVQVDEVLVFVPQTTDTEQGWYKYTHLFLLLRVPTMWDTLQPLSRSVVELYVKVNRTISMHALALQAPPPTKKGDIQSLKNQFRLPGLIQQKP